MKKGYTHIVMIVDRSGSMSNLVSDVVGGYDSFVKDQKKAEGTATMTLVQFDNRYEVNYEFMDIQEVPKIDYIPRGLTAMLDAIGKTISSTGEALAKMDESQRPEKVIVMIQTDGAENDSREYTHESIKNMIKTQEDEFNWDFVFLGANINAKNTAVDIGIKSANAMTFAANSRGMTSALNSVSENLSNVRGGSKLNMSYENKDYASQSEAGAKQ